MGRVLFTIDTWSDQNRWPYLAITAHWIAQHKDTGALKLKTALIAFYRICSGHDGPTFADVVVCLLDRAGITVKVL